MERNDHITTMTEDKMVTFIRDCFPKHRRSLWKMNYQLLLEVARFTICLPFPTKVIYMLNEKHVCKALLLKFHPINTPSDKQDTGHLKTKFYYNSIK